MSLYSSPPAARTFSQDKASLLVCWWCTCFGAVIILVRVSGRYIRSERMFKEDWLALGTIIPLFARMGFLHVIYLYGTNNVNLHTFGFHFSKDDIHHREIGSQLILVTRILYCVILWMCKLSVIEFFKRLTITIWRRSHELMLRGIRWFLAISLIVVIITDLTECHPFNHYWQVQPNPGGACRQGYINLITMGVANVISDILIVIFPIPIIAMSKMPLQRKINLCFLFMGPLLPAGTTLFRIPNVMDRHGSQQYRSLLASIEVLFAVFVSNALILGSFIRDKGVKKQRWKASAGSDTIDRTNSGNLGRQHDWGSDEDLARELGLGLDPELRARSQGPRPARPAPRAASMEASDRHSFGHSVASDEIDLVKAAVINGPTGPLEDENSAMNASRKVAFFDVGGLLRDDSEAPARLGASRRAKMDYDSQPSQPLDAMRRGSAAILQDIGGLLNPRPRQGSRGFNSSRERDRGYELQTILSEAPPQVRSKASTRRPVPPPPSSQSYRGGGSGGGGGGSQMQTVTLQDVGGLLK